MASLEFRDLRFWTQQTSEGKKKALKFSGIVDEEIFEYFGFDNQISVSATYCLNHINNIGLSVLEEYPHDQLDTHSKLFVSEVLSCYVSVFTRFGICTNHQ